MQSKRGYYVDLNFTNNYPSTAFLAVLVAPLRANLLIKSLLDDIFDGRVGDGDVVDGQVR